MAEGLLVAAFDFSTAHADEFHDWYDLEHIPERQAVPGFGACERWIGDEVPTCSVATYDLDSIDVLRDQAYKSIAYDNLSVWTKRVTGMCRRLLRFEGTRSTPGNAAAPEPLSAQAIFKQQERNHGRERAFQERPRDPAPTDRRHIGR